MSGHDDIAAFRRLPPDERLNRLADDDWQLVLGLLGGDWSRRAELTAGISREAFDAWADRRPFPAGRLHDAPGLEDGIYVVADGDAWRVYDQERGCVSMGSEARLPTFEAAKRHAFAMEYGWGIEHR